MKKSELISVYRFLSGLKLNKIEDRTTRNGVITLHLFMHKKVQEFDKDAETLRAKFLEGNEVEVNKLADARKELNECKEERKRAKMEERIRKEFPEMLALEKNLNEAFSDLMAQEVELPESTVECEAFVEALTKQDVDITPTDLISLGAIFKK